MNRTIIISFLILMFATPAIAQNDSDWESKTYELGDFNRIYLEGSYKVYLIQGKSCGLQVKTTDEDVFDDIVIRNNDNELKVTMDREWYNYDHINLYITFNDLEKLKIEGGANVKTKGYLDLNKVFVHVEGGAKVELELKANDVKIRGEGGVLFELDGVSENLEVSISGAGHVDADDLKAKHVKFKIEGFGTGSVYATNTLDANIQGVGKVRFKGDPKVTQYIDGLGSVKRD